MTAVSQPLGTVTLVFTDIEGSTKLLDELGMDAYRDALAEHRRIVREACGRYSGYEVDYEGDAFFYAFSSARDAASAVSEAMSGLASGPIRIRVGIHTGEPGLDPPKYVGVDVHFAARVAASSHGGQVVCSKATADLVEFDLLDLGEHRLKDIEGAVSLYQLGEGSFPPLKTISNTNLPRPASSFVGREAELAAVLSRIEAGARLVTLTGPGGTGKTRLALEAASSLVPAYKAGVFWVGLASLSDAALVVETISQTLGAKDGLAEHIAERELLLLLDNLEQVIEAAPALGELLSVCPNLTLLVTSRELLRVQGEVEYPVPPLAEPEAVALFCERAQLEPSEEIAELCARLDSLPLAVELAAARTKALSPAQILERLAGRLDLLKGGRDADPRQQTLRATIEWSYDLLTEEEQRLFARLSVFAGGCTLEAAEQVCDADLDTLQSLVEKSLLRFTNERYWMLETIREYASNALADSDRAPLRDAHLNFVSESVYGLREPVRRHETWALDLLRYEHGNVREALGWGIGTHASEPAQKILAGAWFYWLTRGLAPEGDSWAMSVVELSSEPTMHFGCALAFAGDFPRFRGDLERALLLKQRALAIFEQLDPGDRTVAAAKAAALADASDLTNDLDAAAEYAKRGLELRRQLGDPFGIAHGLHANGLVARRRGLFDDAARFFAEAVEINEREGDHMEAVESLCDLAIVFRALGDLQQARGTLEAAQKRVEASGDQYLVAYSHAALGLIAVTEGRLDAATWILAQAEVEMRDAGLAFPHDVECEIADALDVCRAQLGDDRYKAASNAGVAAATGGHP